MPYPNLSRWQRRLAVLGVTVGALLVLGLVGFVVYALTAWLAGLGVPR